MSDMDWAEKKAREVLNQWADECEQEAMMSMDPEYLARIKARAAFTQPMKEVWVGHVARALREVGWKWMS